MYSFIKQLLKFGIVGVLCFIIDYGLMVVLTETAGIQYLLSCGIAFSVSVIVNYFLSMHFVFLSRDDITKKTEFIVFVVLSISGLLLTEILMWIGVSLVNIHYMITKIFVTAIVTIYNFVTRKLFLEKR